MIKIEKGRKAKMARVERVKEICALIKSRKFSVNDEGKLTMNIPIDTMIELEKELNFLIK